MEVPVVLGASSDGFGWEKGPATSDEAWTWIHFCQRVAIPSPKWTLCWIFQPTKQTLANPTVFSPQKNNASANKKACFFVGPTPNSNTHRNRPATKKVTSQQKRAVSKKSPSDQFTFGFATVPVFWPLKGCTMTTGSPSIKYLSGKASRSWRAKRLQGIDRDWKTFSFKKKVLESCGALQTKKLKVVVLTP